MKRRRREEPWSQLEKVSADVTSDPAAADFQIGIDELLQGFSMTGGGPWLLLGPLNMVVQDDSYDDRISTARYQQWKKWKEDCG